MGNFWDEAEEEGNMSEYDMLASLEGEEEEEEEEAEFYESEDIDDRVLGEIEEDAAFELDNRESAIIYNARLRLEQAKLYEMLINHNLFEGVESSQQAVKNVQNELKEYIVGRLEILMGMKKEKKVVSPQEIEVSVESEFNDVEKDFLKQLANTGTKGASSRGVAERKVQRISPVSQKPSRGLSPLVKSSHVEESRPIVKSNKNKILKKRTKKPKKTSVKRNTIVSNLGPEPRRLTKDEIERLAKEDIKRDMAILKKGKNWKKLSPVEKSKVLSGKVKRSEGSLPTPTQEQVNMHYQTKVQNRISSGNGTSQFNTILASAIAAQKTRDE